MEILILGGDRCRIVFSPPELKYQGTTAGILVYRTCRVKNLLCCLQNGEDGGIVQRRFRDCNAAAVKGTRAAIEGSKDVEIKRVMAEYFVEIRVSISCLSK